MPSGSSAVNTVGRQCTRGDEVISALGDLLTKMEILERSRRAAHEFATEDLKEHIDLVESQCSLLEEQLRHARKILALSTTLRTSPETFSETEPKEWLDCASTVRSRHRSNSLSQVSKSSQTGSIAKYSRHRSASDAHSDNTWSTTERYKLNLADIPFILSKCTSPSHSLPANLQNLVSLLKKSHPAKRSGSKGSEKLSAPRREPEMRRCRSDGNLRGRKEDPEKELLDLVLQGQYLLDEMERKRAPGSRHSLKCKARWLIKHIDAKLAELNTKQVGQCTRIPTCRNGQNRAQSKNSDKSDFNRIFLRELKRIQKGLEEQV